MKTIKINFVDFWLGFNPHDNYLFNTLRKYFDVEISDKPDILFFSCYTHLHYNYDCKKVYYLAENFRPDFSITDFAISFDYINDPRHLRLPLYVFYFDKDYTVEELVRRKTEEEVQNIISSKQKFCCFVVSNPKDQNRINFFQQLSTYKEVDSGGSVLNNIGYKVSNKLDFVKDYKFIIAFENSSYPGYTTEKVLEPLQVNTVPIYFGNPDVGREMNTNAFINANDYSSFEELIEEIKRVDQDDNLYAQYLRESLFPNHQPNEYFDEQRIVDFFQKVLDSDNGDRVSTTKEYKKLKQAHRKDVLISRIKAKFFS